MSKFDMKSLKLAAEGKGRIQWTARQMPVIDQITKRFIAQKGSICVDGVSLTVNRVKGRSFKVNLIPLTLKVTTVGRLAKGDTVNLEIDLVARYVARLLDG